MCQVYRMEYKPSDNDMICLHSGDWTHDELIGIMDLSLFEESPGGPLRSKISTWLFYEPGSVSVRTSTEDNKAGLFAIALVDELGLIFELVAEDVITHNGSVVIRTDSAAMHNFTEHEEILATKTAAAVATTGAAPVTHLVTTVPLLVVFSSCGDFVMIAVTHRTFRENNHSPLVS